jgi:Domain of unknown function (DUF4340)
MRFRGLLAGAIVLAALAGGVYWSNKKKAAEEAKPAPSTSPDIVKVSPDQITQLAFQHQGSPETVLKRTAEDKWQMTAPKPLPVDSDAVQSVTNTLDPLTSDRMIEDKATDLAPYGLQNPSAQLTIDQKNGKTETIQMGDDTPAGGDVYVKLAGDPRIFTMSSSLKTSLDKSAQDLRDRRLLRFDQEKLARVELIAKNQDIEFGKNNENDWTIIKPRPLRADNFQVEELIRKVREAKMDTGLTDQDAKKAAAAFAGGTPVATVKVTDESGTETLQVHKFKDDYYAKSSAVDGVYKVSTELGEGVNKTVDDFRNKKLFDFGFNEPNKIVIQNGTNAPVTYEKSGENWTAGGKKIDSTSLESFLDKVRDLAATQFTDKGFTAPIFQLTVVSNNGKRTEKVLISKNGDNYFAERENEPTVYQLDPKTAKGLIQAAGDIRQASAAKKK